MLSLNHTHLGPISLLLLQQWSRTWFFLVHLAKPRIPLALSTDRGRRPPRVGLASPAKRGETCSILDNRPFFTKTSSVSALQPLSRGISIAVKSSPSRLAVASVAFLNPISSENRLANSSYLTFTHSVYRLATGLGTLYVPFLGLAFASSTRGDRHEGLDHRRGSLIGGDISCQDPGPLPWLIASV